MTEASTFEIWYDTYPRKVAPKRAQTAHTAALKVTDADTLQKAAEAQAAIWNNLTGYQGKKGEKRMEALKYCPHPATFLNGHYWKNEEIQEYLSRPEEKKPEPIVVNEADPWCKQKRALLHYLGEPVYRQWLMEMVIQSHVNDGYTVYFPTKFKADYVKKAWEPTFESDRVFNARIRFTVAEKE